MEHTVAGRCVRLELGPTHTISLESVCVPLQKWFWEFVARYILVLMNRFDFVSQWGSPALRPGSPQLTIQ